MDEIEGKTDNKTEINESDVKAQKPEKKALLNSLTDRALSVTENVSLPSAGNIKDNLSSMKDGVKEKAGSVATAVSDNVSAVSGSVKETIEGMTNTVSDNASALADGVTGGIDKVASKVGVLIDDNFETIESYCSWCFEKHSCTIKEKNKLSRNVYLCDNSACGQEVVKCRLCSNKAKYSDKWMGESQLCAVHNGNICNFEHLYDKLDHIDEYRKVFYSVSTNQIAGAAEELILGERLSTAVSKSYFDEVEGFSIRKIKDGKMPGVLCVNGFLSQDSINERDWLLGIESCYEGHAIYIVEWEAKRLSDLFSAVKPTLQTLPLAALRSVSPMMIPVSLATTLGLILKDWVIAKNKANKTGVILADIISRTPDQYILVGHSLGTRVIYSCLSGLSQQESGYIQEVHLLGGAISGYFGDDLEKKTNWNKILDAVTGEMHNYYTANDSVLKILYTADKLLTGDPIGRTAINSERINSYDVSAVIGGHTEYIENLTQVLGYSVEKYLVT